MDMSEKFLEFNSDNPTLFSLKYPTQRISFYLYILNIIKPFYENISFRNYPVMSCF